MTLSNSQLRKRRTRARKLVMQALYQWMISQETIDEVMTQFLAQHLKENVDKEYFTEIFRGIVQEQNEIDQYILDHAKRPLKAINPVELSILRLAAYELKNRLELPYKVIINEAIELTKEFAGDEAKSFVNGALDSMAKSHRKAEMQ